MIRGNKTYIKIYLSYRFLFCYTNCIIYNYNKLITIQNLHTKNYLVKSKRTMLRFKFTINF